MPSELAVLSPVPPGLRLIALKRDPVVPAAGGSDSVSETVSTPPVISGVSLVPVMLTATVVVEAAAASEPVAALLSASVSV